MNAVAAPAAMEDVRAAVPERGMRLMLAVLITFIVIQDIFDLPMSLGPGLSAKNALLYILAAALAFRFAVQGFQVEARSIQICFGVLIVYALFSLLAAEWVMEYPRYDVVKSGINLKSRLIDQLIFFLVFFYGLRESVNALTMVKLLLLAVIVANAMAVLDAFGVVQIGDLEERADGRMQGVMGESNQYAAFVSLFLPALTAAVFSSRGFWRLIWLAGLLVSLAGMTMAVSRGAFVAVFVSSIWGALLFRRYVSAGKVAGVAAVAAVLFLIVLAALSVRYGDLLHQRVFGDSSGDLSSASSGRTEMWTLAITRMTQTPLTLLTGFGWEVYWTMPFRYSPHNHYVSQWFNLGLPGLICSVLLFVFAARIARGAVGHLTRARPELMGFVFGTLAIAIAAFFVDLYVPWLWYWAYAGLMLRVAVNTNNGRGERLRKPVAEVPQPVAVPAEERHDSYGWSTPIRNARRA